jgi:hypothetical protein
MTGAEIAALVVQLVAALGSGAVQIIASAVNGPQPPDVATLAKAVEALLARSKTYDAQEDAAAKVPALTSTTATGALAGPGTGVPK